jgi:AraC-like DNA-binding protein
VISSAFTKFRAYDPGEALDAIRRRHAGLLDVQPLKKGTWSYTTSNIRLDGVDIGRQATSGFSSVTQRDDGGLRLMIVHSGAATATAGSTARVYEPRSQFGFCHPDGNGQFTDGYTGVAVRIPVAQLRSALALLDCDVDPLAFAEANWTQSNRPEVVRFCGILTGLLVTCEQTTEMLAIDAFRTAQAQLLTLHAADMIANMASSGGTSRTPGNSASLRACLDFIHTYSHTSLDIADLARFAGISLRTAQSLFAEHLGTTISSYLRSHRLDRVRSRLMTEGEATVTSIALAEGFTHLGEFSRWYARRFGEKPSETLRTGRSRRIF